MATKPIALLEPAVSVPAISRQQQASRFAILKDATRGAGDKFQSDRVIELCLSYVSSTIFSSVSRFLAYFQEREVLPLSAAEPFEICDLSLLYRLHAEDPEVLPESSDKKTFFILDKILALVGRVGVFEGEGDLTFKMSPDAFSMQFASDFVLRTTRGALRIRPRDLFQMMDAYRVPELSLAPDQPLTFVGVTEEEQQFETPDEVNLQKWVRYAPRDCEIHWHIQDGHFSFSRGKINGQYGITQPQRIFIIQAPKGMTLSLTRPLSLVSAPVPLSTVSVVRITEEMALEKDFTFHDKNAIVVIERSLIGLGKKVSIVARNVIVCPTARLAVGELDVRTEGASLLLNVTADVVRLATQRDAVLGNSRITSTKVDSVGNALVFGLNWHTPISLRDHYNAIVSVLEDAIPFDVARLLQAPSRSSVALLKAPEAKE